MSAQIDVFRAEKALLTNPQDLGYLSLCEKIVHISKFVTEKCQIRAKSYKSRIL